MIFMAEWKQRRTAQGKAAEMEKMRQECAHVLGRVVSEVERAAAAEATVHAAAYRRLGAAHRARVD